MAQTFCIHTTCSNIPLSLKTWVKSQWKTVGFVVELCWLLWCFLVLDLAYNVGSFFYFCFHGSLAMGIVCTLDFCYANCFVYDFDVTLTFAAVIDLLGSSQWWDGGSLSSSICVWRLAGDKLNYLHERAPLHNVLRKSIVLYMKPNFLWYIKHECFAHASVHWDLRNIIQWIWIRYIS